MGSRGAAALLAVLGALAACASDRITTPDPVVTPSSAAMWSGETLALTSAAFAGADSLPRFLLAGHVLSAIRGDSFTVRVVLPETTGTFVLRVVLHDGRAHPAATVTLGGGFQRWFRGAPLAGDPVRAAGTTRLLGNGEHGLVWYDARDGVATPALPDSLHDPACAYSPGLPAAPGVLAGWRRAPNGCTGAAWQVAPSLALVDSGPSSTLPLAAAYLGAGRWLYNTGHQTWLYDGAATSGLGDLQQPGAFELSPDGSRVFPQLGFDPNGSPVYDAQRGSLAYRLPRLGYINGVGFTDAGDTAWVVGVGPPATLDSIFAEAVEPATGTVVRETQLRGGFPELVAVDRDRPWLYMVDIAPGCGDLPCPALRVIDRRTLREVTVLRAPAGTPGINWSNVMIPVISAAERRVYVIGINTWLGPALAPSDVFVFGLLP